MRRRPAARPAVNGRPRRLSLLLGAAALGLSFFASPAAAASLTGDTPLAAPVVTPSTSAPVAIGSPMTMTMEPGSAADHVYGYAWSWQPASGVPVYSALPSCGSRDANAGIHFVCGSSVSVRVSPESSPLARFSVWAYDAKGNASSARTVDVSTIDDVAALYPVTHQWTTDQFWSVPPAANCQAGGLTVDCVPDSSGVDAQHENGARPLLLPPGVTWDGSGGGVAGVLTFGAANRLPAATQGAVVDPRQSFAVGAWLTPDVLPAGVPATAIAEEGTGGTGFELGLTADGRWQFRVHTAFGDAIAVAAGTAGIGQPVYVAGVADAINHEVRLYVNGAAATSGFSPGKGHAPDGAATVGGRLNRAGLTEAWAGQVGNPVLAQAALSDTDISRLMWEGFFPGGDGGLN